MPAAAPHRVGHFPAPKEITRHQEAQQRKRDDKTAEAQAYRDVDLRDGRSKCRCCGRHPSKGGGHTHNHLQPRSTVSKAEKHTLANVHGCCLQCNLLLKNQKIRAIGRDCTKPLAFVWTELATPAERKGISLRDERKGP